jgi:phosphoribosylanthranilate isomerase
LPAFNNMNLELPRLPRIKVCGVTLLGDLDFLAAASVDSVGLNFVPHSPRSLSLENGKLLSRRAAELGLLRVAVVMDPTAADLMQLLDSVPVDLVQLHGREAPALADACRGLPIIKATSWTGRPDERELIHRWLPVAETGQLAAWLVDAYNPVAGGGTGQVARWDLLQPRPQELGRVPLILAGGLKPENVAKAVELAAPDGVDAASGVELQPGIKSPHLIQKFVENLPHLWKISTDKPR